MAGTVRHIKDNKYRLEYMLDGQRYSKNIKANNLTQARKLLAIFVTEIEEGIYQGNSNVDFADFAQTFIDDYARQQCQPVTVEGY